MVGPILKRVAFFVVFAAIAVYAVFPFYWAFVSSLRSGPELFSTALIPDRKSTRLNSSH